MEPGGRPGVRGSPAPSAARRPSNQPQMLRTKESSQKPLTRCLLPSDGGFKCHSETSLPSDQERKRRLILTVERVWQGAGGGIAPGEASGRGVPARKSEGGRPEGALPQPSLRTPLGRSPGSLSSRSRTWLETLSRPDFSCSGSRAGRQVPRSPEHSGRTSVSCFRARHGWLFNLRVTAFRLHPSLSAPLRKMGPVLPHRRVGVWPVSLAPSDHAPSPPLRTADGGRPWRPLTATRGILSVHLR